MSVDFATCPRHDKFLDEQEDRHSGELTGNFCNRSWPYHVMLTVSEWYGLRQLFLPRKQLQ